MQAAERNVDGTRGRTRRAGVRAFFGALARTPSYLPKFSLRAFPSTVVAEPWDAPSPLHHHYLSWRDQYAPEDVRAELERATPAEVSAYGDVELYLVEHGLIDRVPDTAESWGEYLRRETT